MQAQRIEDQPALFQMFSARVARGYARDAVMMLTSNLTIDERTLQQLPASQHHDVRLAISNYEGSLGRKILLPTNGEQLPNVRTVARAAYQLQHHDNFEAWGAALQTLERFGVSATLADISPELAQWAREKATTPSFAERIARHFDLTERNHDDDFVPGTDDQLHTPARACANLPDAAAPAAG